MTPQRPLQHHINQVSESQFELSMEMRGWVVSKIDPDYGEDYWIRIFEDGNYSGNMFYVQLKGTNDSVKYLVGEKSNYSIPIEVQHLRQWLTFPVPVFLILWDIEQNAGYWVNIHQYISDQILDDSNWLKSDTQSHNIHIPTSNIIVPEIENDFTSLASKICKNMQSLPLQQFLHHLKKYALAENQNLAISSSIQPTLDTNTQYQLAQIEIYLSLYPENGDLWAEKSFILYQAYDFPKALEAINQAIQFSPDNKDFLYNKACVIAELARDNNGEPKSLVNEAITIFKNADIDSASKNYNIGNSMDTLKNYEDAIKYYELALEANPSDTLAAQIWKNKGTALFHFGKHAEEFSCYQKALDINPNLWQAYVSWATTEIRLENFQHAEELLNKAISLVPKPIHNGYSQMYWLAHCQWKNNKSEQALDTINEVININPTNQDARLLKGQIFSELWRLYPDNYSELALDHFALLFLDDTTNPMVQIELFLLYEQKGEILKARNVLEHALKLDDVPPQALYHHAIQLKLDGKLHEAIDYLEKAYEQSQEHHIVHNLARLKMAVYDYAGALPLLEVAKLDCSDKNQVLEEIAYCCFSLNQFSQCIKILMELIRNAPNKIELWGYLGDSLISLGFSENLLTELDIVVDAVILTVQLNKPIDPLLIFEINKLFSLIEKVLPSD